MHAEPWETPPARALGSWAWVSAHLLVLGGGTPVGTPGPSWALMGSPALHGLSSAV